MRDHRGQTEDRRTLERRFGDERHHTRDVDCHLPSVSASRILARSRSMSLLESLASLIWSSVMTAASMEPLKKVPTRWVTAAVFALSCGTVGTYKYRGPSCLCF